MLIKHFKYMCFPSVMPVGKETKVTVFPKDISRVFRPERNYELCVFGIDDDRVDYHGKNTYDHEYWIENGCLCFTHTFEREQEYSVRFYEPDGTDIRLSVYAVEDDLYHLRPLKGELHTHTYYSDGKDGLAMTPSDYREAGYDFVAITDHHRMFPSELAADLYKDVAVEMNIVKGEEIHAPGTSLHIVNIGGESVCSQYIKDPEGYEQEVTDIESTLTHVPELYRRRTAIARWACEKVHKSNGIAIFAHPFWYANTGRHNVSKEFCDILFDENIFDAFELMGGIPFLNNNKQLALWQQQIAKGNNIPVVGNADSHSHDYWTRSFARNFTIAFAADNTTEAIIDAIKNGNTVAAEIPSDSTDEIRFYGSKMRLVEFSHFLYNTYFQETLRLCICDGVLMRRYAEGEDVGDILQALYGTVEKFYQRFFGYLPAPVITTERQKFLDKARERQINEGPVTKGTSLSIIRVNHRRE